MTSQDYDLQTGIQSCLLVTSIAKLKNLLRDSIIKPDDLPFFAINPILIRVEMTRRALTPHLAASLVLAAVEIVTSNKQDLENEWEKALWDQILIVAEIDMWYSNTYLSTVNLFEMMTQKMCQLLKNIGFIANAGPRPSLKKVSIINDYALLYKR